MNKAVLFPLAAALAFGITPARSAPNEPVSKPLTESDLLKTLNGLGKGDPATKAPLSANDHRDLPKSEAAKPDIAPKGDVAPKGDLTPAKKGKPDPNDPAAKQTEITSEEGTFDSKTHQAVFTVNVFVLNPDFTVSCDKLTAYMKHDEAKGDKKGANAKATPSPNATPAATPAAGPTRLTAPTVDAGGAKVTTAGGKAPDAATGTAGGLEKAIAEGNVVITQDKVDDDGNITHNVGHGRKAVYIAETGDITLTGNPDVQQGINTCVSLEDTTVIILNRDGHMKTIGKTKNVIRESTTPDKPTPGKATPARVSPPNGR